MLIHSVDSAVPSWPHGERGCPAPRCFFSTSRCRLANVFGFLPIKASTKVNSFQSARWLRQTFAMYSSDSGEVGGRRSLSPAAGVLSSVRLRRRYRFSAGTLGPAAFAVANALALVELLDGVPFTAEW